MGTEMLFDPRRVAQRAHPSRGRAALWLCLCLGCLTQRPSGEGAPSTPSTPSDPPRPEPAPAEAPAPAEPPHAAPPDAPASGKGIVESSAGGTPPAPTPAPARVPAKPASKTRSSSRPEAAAEAERAIGGAGGDVEDDAPSLRQRLDRVYRASSPDCPSARERKKAVCALASQICQLIDRDPNVASVAEYCSEAKERCSEAERRTRERCPT